MIIILISFFMGLLGAFVISKYATTWNLFDLPNKRSSHRVPTPRGGGIGIAIAVILAAIICQISWAVWVQTVVLATTSFVDDRWGMAVRTRILVQFGCAATVVYSLHQCGAPLGGFVTLGIFWIIFITATANFYNFMDGINGISGITGVMAFGALGIVAYLLKHPIQEYVFNFSVAGACLGFLPLNIYKARVFMGDIGSVLLGFLFAVQVYRYSDSFMMLLLLSGFLFLFYVDTMSTLFVRWRDGEKLTQSHRRHLYQIFANQLEQSHWKIALGYGIIQTVISSTLLLAYFLNSTSVIVVLAVWFLIFLIVTYTVRMRISRCSFPNG